MYGPDTLAIGVFPLVAVGFLVFTLWKGRQNCHLLQDGLLTTAKLINMEEKRGQKGGVRYELMFEFQNAQGQLRYTSVTVSNPAYLTDEPREFVLYDPHNENRVVLLDAIPGRPRIAEDGTLHSTSPQFDLLMLLLPAAAILGHGWYLVRHVLT